MAMRRESNARMADFAVADVSLFWLLNALNSAEPVLSELHQDPSRHPELLYRELARLAGSLMTFSLEHHLEAIPPLPACLAGAGIPAAVCPAGYAARSQPALKGDRHRSGAGRRPGDLAGQATRCATARGADFYLSVRSSLPLTSYRAAFPQLCKAGSHDDVAEVVNIALSGIAIKPLRPRAGGHSATSGKPIFRSGSLHRCRPARCWRPATAPSIPPESLGDVKLELFAVLRS